MTRMKRCLICNTDQLVDFPLVQSSFGRPSTYPQWFYRFSKHICCPEYAIDETLESIITTNLKTNVALAEQQIENCKRGLKEWLPTAPSKVPLLVVNKSMISASASCDHDIIAIQYYQPPIADR